MKGILNYNRFAIVLIIFIFSIQYTKGSNLYYPNNGYTKEWNDTVYLAAEAGIMQAPMEIRDDALAIDGKYVFAEGNTTSYDEPHSTGKITFKVALNAGDYKIWGRVIFADGQSDSYWVQVDDTEPVKWKAQRNVVDWEWLEVAENSADIATWSFAEPDTHTVIISLREPATKIDEIYITNQGDTPLKGELLQPTGTKTIYVSHDTGVDEGNEGGSESTPIKTLARAYEIAHENYREFEKFEIFLRRGETFENFQVVTSSSLDVDPNRNTFAFIWDINRELIMGAYGEGNMPKLYGNRYRHDGFPTSGIGVCDPSTKKVVIEDLHLERFQVCAMNIFETENVEVINCKVNEIGTHYFFSPQNGGIATDGGEQMRDGLYVAGVIYPKNSNNVLIDGLTITNCHNHTGDETNLHGFYCTRLSQSEIKNCHLKNISGSPLKFRRSPANNVHVHDNEFYYTGHSEQLGYAQPGWLRYSGDSDGGCPYAIVIEDNIFHYPYCISELEDCGTAMAIKCSISNTGVCGEGACEDPEKVLWRNNDFIYQWQTDTVTSVMDINLREKKYCVYDLYPNPFSDKTVLKIDFDRPSLVSISIIDGNGREVQNIMRDEKLDGYFSVPIEFNNATDYRTNGIYYCRIKIDNHVESLKILHIK